MRGPGPGGAPGALKGKAKDSKKTFFKLASMMKPYRMGIIFVGILCICAAVATAVGPLLLGNATNLILEGINSGAGVDFDGLINIIFILLALYLVSAVFNYIMMVTVAKVAQNTTYSIRGEIDKKLGKLPLSYYDSNPFGDILSRVTNDVDTVANTIQQGLSQVISSMLTVVVTILMMFMVSPWLLLVALVSTALSAVFSVMIIKRNQPYFKGQQKATGDLNGYVEEMYSGHNIIKAFSGEEEVIEEFEALNTALYNNSWKANFGSGLVMPAITFCTNLGYILVGVSGAFLSVNGMVSIGAIQSMIQYLRQLSHPISSLANISNIFQSGMAAAERIFELLEEEEEPKEAANPQVPKELKGRVDIEHIKFGYSPERTLISDMSLSVKSGDKIAIVGSTGAGKTTLVNLILRFYDVKDGVIKIDGVNINDMSRYNLRSIFGMVLQDTWLFKGSIMDNIRYGRLDATDEEVVEAAKNAFAHKFISQLPDGYDFMLQEDALNISQGQRQLLTIARAILSNPTILILDEATSSVDTRTELLIQRAMNNLMDNRTSFVIAHRLSTIRDADTIVVMENGDIVEMGNHNSLLKIDGYYKKLYTSQFAQEEAV